MLPRRLRVQRPIDCFGQFSHPSRQYLRAGSPQELYSARSGFFVSERHS